MLEVGFDGEHLRWYSTFDKHWVAPILFSGMGGISSVPVQSRMVLWLVSKTSTGVSRSVW